MSDKNDTRDSADVILEKTKDFVVLVITTMLDCMEDSFNCMTYAKGKNLKYVLLISFTFIPITVIFPKLGYNVLIPWQDALIAFIVMFIIFAINNVNKASIESSVVMMQSSLELIESSAKKAKDVAVKTKEKINTNIKERRK